MKLLTSQILAEGAAQAWARQYGRGDDEEKVATQKRLDAMDRASISPQAVNNIIGNNLWTQLPNCDECQIAAAVLVEIGEEPDYESATAHVCLRCLKAAVKLASQGE